MASGTVNILSIDGGAMMGVVPARLLSYIEGNASGGTVGGVTVPNPVTVSGGKVPNIASQSGDAFQYIAGTSTGGLLAAALGITPLTAGATGPLTANGALDFYLTNAATIFPGSVSEVDMLAGTTPSFGNLALANTIAGSYGAPSGAQALSRTSNWPKAATFTKTAVTNPFTGDNDCATLSQAKPTLLITTFNNNFPQTTGTPPLPTYNVPEAAGIYAANSGSASTPPGPLFLTNTTTDSSGNSLSVLQACLMTSAFPMLLPPVPYDLQFDPSGSDAGSINYFLDGGIYAGSPAMAAYFFAIQNDLEIQSFISIGCGSTAIESGLNYQTVWDWGSGLNALATSAGWMSALSSMPLLDLMSHAPATVTNGILSQLLPGKFFRLQPQIPAGAGPAWSNNPSTLNSWLTAADTLVSTMNSTTEPGKDISVWQAMINAVTGQT